MLEACQILSTVTLKHYSIRLSCLQFFLTKLCLLLENAPLAQQLKKPYSLLTIKFLPFLGEGVDFLYCLLEQQTR